MSNDASMAGTLTFIAWFVYLFLTASSNYSMNWLIFFALPIIGFLLWVFSINLDFFIIKKKGSSRHARGRG